MAQTDISRREVLGLAVLVEGGLAALACLLGLWLAVPPWQQTKLTALDLALGLAASVPMLASFIFFLRRPWGPWRNMARLADDMILPLFRRSTIADLACISILAGVGEE